MPAPIYEPMFGYGTEGSSNTLCSHGGWTTDAPGSGNYDATDGPHGEGKIGLGGFGSYNLRRTFTPFSGRLLFQWHYRLDDVSGGGSATMVQLRNNSDADVCFELRSKSDGAIEILDANGTIVHTTDAGLLTLDVYSLIGLEVDVGSSGGSVKLWVDEFDPAGDPLVSMTGQDLSGGSSGGCDGILLHGGGSGRGASHSLTGFISGTGEAEFNSYQGNRCWRSVEVAGAGASAQWTPNTGTNPEAIDDSLTTSGDDDTTYVESPASAGYDAYELADSSAVLHGVAYVAAVALVKADGAGTPGATQLRLRSAGGTNDDGPTLSTTTAYKRYYHGSANIPGGTGWTKAGVDGLQAGFVSAGDTSPKHRVTALFVAVFAFPDDYTPPGGHCCGSAMASMLV